MYLRFREYKKIRNIKFIFNQIHNGKGVSNLEQSFKKFKRTINERENFLITLLNEKLVSIF